MRYETRFFKKAESLIKTVKKIFFENTKYLASIYKSDDLNDKLSKMTIYIYIRVYFIFKSTTSRNLLKKNFNNNNNKKNIYIYIILILF